MKLEEQTIFRRALLLCLLLLTPFIYFSFFCWPIADDLTYAWKGQKGEFLKTILDEYQFWNGRYFSNILVLHNPFGYGSLLLYQLVPIALIFGIVLSAQHYFQSLFRNAFSYRTYWIWGILFALLFLFSMPDISEGIYWYTGSVSYTLGSILLLFSFSFALRKQSVFTLIFLFFGMGCSEVCMLFGLVVFGAQHFILKRKNWLILLAAIVFAAIVYFAPGNAIRSDLFEAKHQFFHSFVYSLAQTARFNFYFFGIALFLSSIIWLNNMELLKERSTVFRNSFGLNWKSSWLFLLIPVFISAFPAYWSTGILGQHRTMNVACFFWILAWFANLCVWYNQLKWRKVCKKYVTPFIFLLLVIPHFILRKDSFSLIEEIIQGKHIIYSNIMEERWRRMEKCNEMEPGGTIYLPADNSNCKTLDVLPLYEPKHWMNEGYALFSNCPDITIAKE